MNVTIKAKIFFLRVTDNSVKLRRLCTVVQKHFENEEAILITAPSDEAARYIDQLLWRMPEESFIPHAIVNTSTKERIVITTSTANINQATTLINLCSNAITNIDSFRTIYELLDQTQAAKEDLSRQRQNAYRHAGYAVEEI